MIKVRAEAYQKKGKQEARLWGYGQETHRPILIAKGEARQVYADFARWLDALGLPTKEMKKQNARTKTTVQNTSSMVCHKK